MEKENQLDKKPLGVGKHSIAEISSEVLETTAFSILRSDQGKLNESCNQEEFLQASSCETTIKKRKVSLYPELISISSPDIEAVESYVPQNPNHFGHLFNFFFGLKDTLGMDYFNVFVCTKSWLNDTIAKHTGIFDARGCLVVSKYDFNEIKSYASKHAKQSFGRTEKEVVYKLSRMGQWEFEAQENTSESDSEQ